jgi:putative hydrolase of the HAD superfamily
MSTAKKRISKLGNKLPVNALIFDGDDTLWETQTLYDQVKNRFANLMKSEGFSSRQALALLVEIDLENIRKLGFSRQRFPRSLKETYLALVSSSGQKKRMAVLRRISTLGKSVFRRSPRLIAGARALLRSLHGKVQLVLMTAGDPTVQRRRIKTSGLEKYFDFIDIPRIKTPREYERLVKRLRLQPSRTWMIGNSMKSDILPAHEIGLRTLWVAGRGWEYDRKVKEGELGARVRDLKKVKDILVPDL